MNVFQTTSNFNHNNYYYNQPNHNSPISSSSSSSSVYSGQLVCSEENFYTNLDNTNNSLIHMFMNNEQKTDQNLISSSNQMFGSPSSSCSFNSSNGNLNWTPVSQTGQEEEVVLCQLDELTKNLNKKNNKMDYDLSNIPNNIDQKRIDNYDFNSNNMFQKTNIGNDCHYDSNTFNYNYQQGNNQVNLHLDLHQQHSPNTIHQLNRNSPNSIHQIQRNSPNTLHRLQRNSPNNIHQIQQNSPNSNQLPMHFANDSNNKKIMNQISNSSNIDQPYNQIQTSIHNLQQSNSIQPNNLNYLKNDCVSASVNTLNAKIINSSITNQTISISNIKTTIKCQKEQILNTDSCSISLKTDLNKSLNEFNPNAIIGYDSEGRPIRNTANKKERRRTLSINNAFSNLRDCIPNVPADTKLSKIKTLRLATCYISYLMDLLNQTSPLNKTCEDFIVDLQRFKGRSKNINLIYPKITDKPYNRKTQSISCEFRTTQCLYSNQQLSLTNGYNQISKNEEQNKSLNEDKTNSSVQLFNQCSNIEQYQQPNKRLKSRTGWPQYVWASELQQNQN